MCRLRERAVREEDLLGPLTGAYLRWLFGESLSCHASGILFLSREGGFFLKAWEKLGFQACLKAFHLECSRESLGRALEEEDQGEAFFRYLKGFGLQGRVVLADLGWGGTMQRMLTDFAAARGMDLSFLGLYMGLSESAAGQEGSPPLPARGFLFDAIKAPPCPGSRHLYTPEAPFIGLFESLFLEMKGSVAGYRILAGGEVLPERGVCEFRTGEGALLPEGEMILSLQEKALENLKGDRDLTPGEAFAPLLRLGMEPTTEEARRFGRIPFLDQGRVLVLARPRSPLFYLVRPIRLLKDFRESRWKMGFLRLLLGGSRSWKGLYDLCRGFYRIFQRKEKSVNREKGTYAS